jgi:hypothetical protein
MKARAFASMIAALGAAGLTTLLWPVHAASSLAVSDGEITVVVPLEVEGASDELTGAWMEAIDAAWNKGNKGGAFHYCGRPVRFVPVFKQIAPSGTMDPGYHGLFVMPVRPGQYFVSKVLHQAGSSPTQANRNGFIADTASAATVAHEFGHYLGLDDEYLVIDRNGNGQRDEGDTTRPNTAAHADAASSLMGTLDGAVFQRHIDEALEEHGIADALQCPTEILVRGVYTTQPVGGCNGDRATIEARVTADGRNDSYAGQGPVAITWRALNRCPNTLFGGYRVAPGTTSTLEISARYDLRSGHAVTISTSGHHQSLFLSGEPIASGNFIQQWPEIVKGTNVRGTLASFTVPHGEWITGAVFRFENREGVLGPGGDMRLFGSGTVEICPTSSAGPFEGCTTSR